jgi:hypothetical protein
MGDTISGLVNTAFGFNPGTDLTPWIGNMFTTSNFSWATTGTTQFTTYYFSGGLRTPGIGISAADLVGSLWTPDNVWTKAGTYATLGLTEGTYAITDAVTGESITIQIGGEAVIPEPSTIAIWSLLGLVGLGYGWRKKRKAA